MSEVQSVVNLGLEMLGQGLLSEAEELVSEALGRSSENGRLWELLGRIRHRTGDREGAREALEMASLLVPLNPRASGALADCYLRMGQTDLAAILFLGLARNDDCPADLLPGVAAGLGTLGKHREALEVCRTLLKRDPTWHEAHFGVAFYRRRLGESPAAVLEDVARAFELAPEVPLYRVTLATLLERVGFREEAIELIHGLDLRQVGCRCCLRRMMAILQGAEDSGESEPSTPPTD